MTFLASTMDSDAIARLVRPRPLALARIASPPLPALGKKRTSDPFLETRALNERD
ncbi:hypothetical protein Q31b_08950 [Novipirellula aureliae]|uniref:Uncharacterized protein n=1 Tax=Novipirellula aureliae TaxID=2527966 RepID=A0A5C6EEQ6_9BACT|nr:hypothetical protein Q31b_08950 [Novipirellula aureliae]